MTNKNSSTGIATRCQFHFSDGRCCRMLRSPAHSFFCAFHARQQLQLLESQRLGGEISTSLHGDFLTATDINHVLGKLFIAVAEEPFAYTSLIRLDRRLAPASRALIRNPQQLDPANSRWRNCFGGECRQRRAHRRFRLSLRRNSHRNEYLDVSLR